MQSHRIALSSLALCSALTAQNDMGIETGAGSTNWVTRTSTSFGSACLTRWDYDDYRGVGFDHANSGTYLTGISGFAYDFENPGVESFAFSAAEQGGPNLPDWLSYTVLSGSIALPAVGTFEARVNFTNPVFLNDSGDVYVGYELGARPVGETNGLWFWCVRSEVAGNHDLGGPAVDVSSPTADTYTYGTINLINTLAFGRRYLLCDPIVYGAAGMATTMTNQAAMTSSATAPGIAGFYSGLHPDVNGFNAGRADSPGFRYVDASMAGQPVLFFISFGGLRSALSPLTLHSVFPGSSGSFCLNDGLFLGAVPASGIGVAVMNLPLDAAARAVMGGSGLAAQMFAMGFDGSRLSGSPCANVVY